MSSILAAEGGYQEFVCRAESSPSWLCPAVSALLAIAVGFVLMRGVLAAGPGHAEDDRDRHGDPGGRVRRT